MIRMLPIPSQEELARVFSYDANRGVLVRKIMTSPNAMPGMVAGSRMSNGYISVTFRNKRYLAHRLIWMLVNGGDPLLEIDHINRVRDDNRIENLRPVGMKGNSGNIGLSAHNTSGAKGVCWDKSRSKWIVHIKRFGRQKFLGRYAKQEDAIKAYDAAAIAHFGACALTNAEMR